MQKKLNKILIQDLVPQAEFIAILFLLMKQFLLIIQDLFGMLEIINQI